MPPRYSYWTILAGGLPTAFRAAERSELEPTFNRLREKHPDAVMKWFARGKLWESPEAARAAYRRDDAGGDSRSRRAAFGNGRETRGRDWRPGGDHRDPRQKFKDARKARNQERRQAKFDRKHEERPRERPVPHDKPHGDKLTGRPAAGGRVAAPPARDAWRDRAPRKPHGDKLRPEGRRFSEGGKSQGNAPPRGGRRPGQEREPGWRAAPQEKWRASAPRGWRDERSAAAKPRHDRPDRTPREKPHGDPLPRGRRPFDRGTFPRGQGVEQPQPPRPRGPNREPRPGESPQPTPPPRPSEPAVPPPGPPERGRPKPKRNRG